MSDDRDRFDRVVATWVDSHQSPNTQAAYRRDLDVFRSWWDKHRRRTPMTATPNDVEQFEQACIDTGASQATVARRVSALSSFFSFAVAHGALTRSPVGGNRQAPTTATPTIDLDARQLAALIRSSGRLSDRAALLVGLLLFDGVALGDVLAADAADVAVTAGVAQLALHRRRDQRAVALDPRTTSALNSYLDGRTTGPLLLGESPTRPPARLTRFGADYLLKQVSALAGVEPAISANTLRRSFITTAFTGGASIEAIRDRLGHADVRTTRRHLTPP